MQAADRRITEDQFDPPRGFHRLERRQTTGFMDLLEPNLGPLKRYVASVLKHSADVEDIVQQTALKAYVHLDQFRFEAQFGTWLRRIALNEIRQLHRQRSRLRTAEGVNLEIADGRESAQAVWERRETAQEVHRAIRRLSAKHRAVVALRYLNGLDLAEIAERLSISTGAVKIRLHRARRQLVRDLSRTGILSLDVRAAARTVPAPKAVETRVEDYGTRRG